MEKDSPARKYDPKDGHRVSLRQRAEALTLGDNCRIAIRKRRPISSMNTERKTGQLCCLPVHPAFRVEARPDVCWAEPANRALLCQIADDHVRFTELSWERARPGSAHDIPVFC